MPNALAAAARRPRNALYVLRDNLIGYDDGVATPGERLGAGLNALATGLWRDPVGMVGGAVMGAKRDLDDLMFHGGAERRPQDVLGYAMGASAPSAAAIAPPGALLAGPRRFKKEMRGYHHGQSDMTLSVADDDGPMGRVDFAEYDGDPSIQMIEVDPARRREGAATALLQELQRAYPDKEIDWGSLTDDGAKLYARTAFNEVPSQWAPKFDLLDKLDAQMADLEVKIKDTWGTPEAEAAMRRFYELEDRKRRISNFVEDHPRTLRLIDTGDGQSGVTFDDIVAAVGAR